MFVVKGLDLSQDRLKCRLLRDPDRFAAGRRRAGWWPCLFEVADVGYFLDLGLDSRVFWWQPLRSTWPLEKRGDFGGSGIDAGQICL
jgi:hypothetical protein